MVLPDKTVFIARHVGGQQQSLTHTQNAHIHIHICGTRTFIRSGFIKRACTSIPGTIYACVVVLFG